ncbi:MAG TPA: homoaconitase [Phycisphaerae bacterium]|nr:homoaconitase [Phycisphaerae bacterium]
MGQTLIEKIVTRYATGLAEGEKVYAGDIVSVRPKHVMTHDNTSAVIPKFKTIGAAGVHDPRQPVYCLDHDIQNTSPDNLAKYAKIEAFAAEHGIDFFKAGTGIGHQIMVEEGYVTPGSMVVASDSHSNLYGGVAALGTPVVRTDAAALWATGETWWEVLPVAKVHLMGRLQPGVVGKDVIITLCGVFNNDEVLNHVVEFAGDHLADLTMDQRLSIANMTTEWGALAGVFPFDEVCRDYLYGRADAFARRGDDPPRYTRADVDRWYAERLQADADAYYAKDLTLDLSKVTPHVAGPNEVKVITPLPQMEQQKVKVDKAYLLSCVNARLEDLTEAANVLKGKKVADHVQLYVAAASASVQDAAQKTGVWDTLVEAGARVLPPGCGPCIGLGEGTLEAGEVGISATNRNFQGRMGSREASVYLASPAVVAASAAAGYMCAPQRLEAVKIEPRVKENPRPKREAGAVSILAGFPEKVEGRLLLLPKDDLNTDGIYGKDVTYRDDLTPEQMGQATMLNYDPEFQKIAVQGDIIVGCRNFGCGSSREQAATALAYRGIRMVIAASFSQTYKRNAFNNGFVVFECPDLVTALRDRFADQVGDGPRTVPTPGTATVSFADSTITYDGRTFPFTPLKQVAQELIVAGGAEALVQKRLASTQ